MEVDECARRTEIAEDEGVGEQRRRREEEEEAEEEKKSCWRRPWVWFGLWL